MVKLNKLILYRGYRKDVIIELNKDLQYDGDLVLIVYNERPSAIGESKKEKVGQFSLKLKNIRATKIRIEREGILPDSFFEFYNIVKESKIKGRILAFFDLSPCEGDNKEIIEYPETKDGLTMANVEKIDRESTEATIKITVMGLRNLKTAAKKPMLTFKLTNDQQNEIHELKINSEKLEEQSATCNPYILNTISFNTKLSDKIIDWPYLNVTLSDEAFFGCGKGHTTLLLFPYASNFIPQSYIESTLLTFNTQVEANKTKQRAGSSQKGSSRSSKLSYRSMRTITGSHLSRSKKSDLTEIESISNDGDDDRDKESKCREIPEKEDEEIKTKKGEPEIKMTKVEAEKLDEDQKKQEEEENKLLEEDKVEEDKVSI